MNKLFVSLIAIFILSSCGTIKEEIYIYPDQTAEMEFSMELGKSMSESFSTTLGSLLTNNLKSNNNAQPKITGNFNIMGLPVNNEESTVDTIIYLKDIPSLQYDTIHRAIAEIDSTKKLSGEQQARLAHQLHQVLNNSSLRFRNNVPDYFLVLSLKTGKTDIQELLSMGRSLKTILADTASALGQENTFFFRTDKKTFERGSFSFWKDALFTFTGGPQGEPNFLEMLMNGMKMKEFVSIVHLPGKVKSVSNPASVISNRDRGGIGWRTPT